MRPLRCHIYFQDEGVFIIRVRPGLNGIWECFGPITRLDAAPGASELGGAVRQALDDSGMPPQAGPDGRPVATHWDEVMRAAGIRSWTRLTSSSRCLTVEDDRDQVVVDAWNGPKATCSPDADEIGRTLLEALPSCPLSDPISPARPGRSYHGPRSETVIDGGTPEGFGYKTSWILVDTTDAEAVVGELGLKHVRPARWGIDPYRTGGVFVSPSVLGWTFVLGYFTQPNFPEFVPLLEGLSRRFGEVQFFGSHRVVDYQAWAKAIDSLIVRAYCWVGERGEISIDAGERTPEELELGFDRFLDSRTIEGDWGELTSPNEEDVMHLASKWSINPLELDAYDTEGPGFLGEQP